MGNTLLDRRPSEEAAFEQSEYEIAYGEDALSWATSIYVRIGALTVAALAIGAIIGIMASELTGESTSAELTTPPTTAAVVEQDPGLSESLTPDPSGPALAPLVIGADEADPSTSTSTSVDASSTTATTAAATSTSARAADSTTGSPAALAATTAPSAETTATTAPNAGTLATTASTARRTTTTAGSPTTNGSGPSTTMAAGGSMPGNDGGSMPDHGNSGGDGSDPESGQNDGSHGDHDGSHGGHAPTPGSWVRASSENARYPDGPIATTHHIFNPYSSNAPAGWGASRIGFLVHCEPVMTAQIDPIVNPGQARSGHLHEFFGNPNVTPNSTTQSLANTPTSQIDCTDKNDKSAYWSPTVYQNGQRVKANAFKAYYKSPKPNTVPMPFGLRMVAGNAGATKNQDRSIGWWQSEENITTAGKNSMITKSSTGKVRLRINFPNCWDGVHLDSPDHQSHVAYARGGNCPSSHPVAIPQVVTFTDYVTNGGSSFSLASGPWYTFHQDFWNVWSPDQMEALHERCNLAEMNCRARRSPDLVPRGQQAVSIRG